MRKILSTILIAASLGSTAQAMDDYQGIQKQIVNTAIEELKAIDPTINQNEDRAKSVMDKLEYFDLICDDFKLWIYDQKIALGMWYDDIVKQKHIQLCTEFLEEKQIEKNLEYSLYMMMPDDNNNTIVFRRENSSGHKCNCLLYSIIRENKSLLTRILGDEWGGAEAAEQILAIPEIAGRPLKRGEKTRDFTIVRTKILQDIQNALDQNNNLSTFITHMLKDPAAARGYKAKEDKAKIKNYIENDLEKKSQTLPQEMALVISALYGLNVQVLHPMSSAPTVLSEAIKLTEEQLELYDPRNIDPIYVYHKGFGGNHYEKLFTVE